jgi:hypothetical protein
MPHVLILLPSHIAHGYPQPSKDAGSTAAPFPTSIVFPLFGGSSIGSSIGTETLSSSSNKFAAFVEDAVGMGASALGSTIEIGSDEEDMEDDVAAAEKERLVRRMSMLPVSLISLQRVVCSLCLLSAFSSADFLSRYFAAINYGSRSSRYSHDPPGAAAAASCCYRAQHQ